MEIKSIYNEYNEPIAVDLRETKITYEGKMERQLKEVGAKIDQFMDKADVAKQKTLQDLKIKHEDTWNKLQELKSTSAVAWYELKQGLDRAWVDLIFAWEDLRAASEKAAAKFGTKN